MENLILVSIVVGVVILFLSIVLFKRHNSKKNLNLSTGETRATSNVVGSSVEGSHQNSETNPSESSQSEGIQTQRRYSDRILEREIDFENYEISQEDFARIYADYLGYRTARGSLFEVPDRNDRNSGMNYAKVIDCLIKYKPHEYRRFRAIVQFLFRNFRVECQRMGITYGDYGNDHSWVGWDVAKQLFFYMGRNVRRQRGYLIANPLVNRRLQRQIVNRHLGWEVDQLVHYRRIDPRVSGDREINRLRERWRNESGGNSSLGLIEIGKRTREILI